MKHAQVVWWLAFTLSSASAAEWQQVALMPHPNHDISGGELAGRFYVAGGCAQSQVEKRGIIVDEIWELSADPWQWRVAAKLSRARAYCSTASFDGKIWVVGGDVVDENGKRFSTKLVEWYDPKTGEVTAGPESLVARPTPVALVAGGRLYVAGAPVGGDKLPGPMESIGPGETEWRREPDGPTGMSPLAGTAWAGKLYLNLPKPGLAIFDTATGIWETMAPLVATRSSQMAAYGGEIWMMGGRNSQGGQQTEIFNPTTCVWRRGPPLPEELSWGAAGVMDDALVVTGGWGPGGLSDRTYAWREKNTASQPGPTK